MAVKVCTVGFVDVRGTRHAVTVEAESVYEAAVLAVRRFRKDPWVEHVGSATVFDIEVREEASSSHSVSLQQVERWLAGVTTSPSEATKKAKLKLILVQG